MWGVLVELMEQLHEGAILLDSQELIVFANSAAKDVLSRVPGADLLPFPEMLVQHPRLESMRRFSTTHPVSAGAGNLEDLLLPSGPRSRRIAEQASSVFWLRSQSELLYVSPAFATIAGTTPDAIYRDFEELSAMVHPDDRAVLGRMLDRADAFANTMGVLIGLATAFTPLRDALLRLDRRG